MKKIVFSFLVALTTLTANAQKTDKQMATLQHGNQTMVFYGINAFVQAYEAAADTLDVITLSSGEFNSPGIVSKSITVYGAGFEDDEVTGTNRTFINGRISLYPADAVDDDGNVLEAAKHVNGVHLEGLNIEYGVTCVNYNNVPINNLSIVKCYLSSLDFSISCHDCSIRQSVINSSIYNYNNPESNIATNLLISNCWIGYGVYGFDYSSTIRINHCICWTSGWNPSYGPYEYINNIMFALPKNGAIVRNNVFIGCEYTSDISESNWNNLATAGVFAAEGEDGEYAAGKDFALKYPKKHTGNDGTEIGLHGGTYAWNKIPLIPRITSYELDTSNAANGTIKVSIKAEAQTKE